MSIAIILEILRILDILIQTNRARGDRPPRYGKGSRNSGRRGFKPRLLEGFRRARACPSPWRILDILIQTNRARGGQAPALREGKPKQR